MIRSLLCFILIATIFLTPISTLAAQMNFTPTAGNCGTVSIKMPIQRLGTVELPRGRVSIKGNTIEVTTIPEWMFDRMVVLSGPVLRAVSTINTNRAVVVGIAYFQDGPWLKYVDDPNRQDILMTSDGTFTGKIVSAGSESIVFQHDGQQQTIPIANLKDIRSPRAYTFAIPAALTSPAPADNSAYQAEATGLTLRPTSGSYKLAALKRDLDKEGGDWSTSQIVLLGAAFSALELAQLAFPLVYALEGKGLKRTAKAVQMNTVSEQVAFPPQPIPFTQLDVMPPLPPGLHP